MATEDIFNLTDTWNAGGTTFSAIKMNVTDTASASGSLLLDLQVGGSSKFSVTKGGVVAFTGVTNPSNSYFTQYGSSGHQFGGYAAIGGAGSFGGDSAINLSANFSLSWSSTTYNPALAPDLQLYRDAANTLAQRNSTNAQAFRVYNTYTDASNYERGEISWSGNVLTLGATAAGTGTGRPVLLRGSPLSFAVGGTPTTVWQITATGHLVAGADNTYDIGASGATRPRNLYMGSWIRMAVTTVASLPVAATAGAGARMMVSDALSPVFGSAVAGGGAVTVPVYSTGAAWNVG